MACCWVERRNSSCLNGWVVWMGDETYKAVIVVKTIENPSFSIIYRIKRNLCAVNEIIRYESESVCCCERIMGRAFVNKY